MGSEVQINGDRLTITHIFEAPRAKVFKWWTTPERLSRWSRCKEATDCQVEMDFRVGGGFTQRLMIHEDCAVEITGSYTEIVEPERIAYDASFGGDPAHVTIDFIEEAGKTKVILTHDNFAEGIGRSAVSQGTCESLETLDEALSESALA